MAAVVGELFVEFVGGPFDGLERSVPAVCECGADLAPGAVLEYRGAAYVLGENRCYAFFLPEVQAA